MQRVSRSRRVQIALLAFGILSAAGSANAQIPAGFTRIFNGRDLTGWHSSHTTHHGSLVGASVVDGAIALRQEPFGQGGILMTNREYKNFELYLEAKLPWGINSGIFLRSSDGGSAYQVELLGGGTGNTGSLISEGMPLSKPAPTAEPAKLWKENDWNSFRIRVEGDIPHLTAWFNGVQIWDLQQDKNDKIGGETTGFIGLQSHYTGTFVPVADFTCCPTSWKPGAVIYFRNIAIKELP
jgi:hypothetical protein